MRATRTALLVALLALLAACSGADVSPDPLAGPAAGEPSAPDLPGGEPVPEEPPPAETDVEPPPPMEVPGLGTVTELVQNPAWTDEAAERFRSVLRSDRTNRV
ncbi:MAG: hypothetical protein FJ098_03875, partial [Deltaproteobacteria bacterium]|nr:hypothetical protein [Deltaproteobacteria bacterium]